MRTLLEIALTQVGKREDPPGSNKGKDVEGYLSAVGLGGGYAWCMAFVVWCAKLAAKEQNIPLTLKATGGVLDQWRRVPASTKLVQDVADSSPGAKAFRDKQIKAGFKLVQNPAPGDIFIMDFGKGLGHTGIVKSVGKDGLIYTVEGNTDANGSRTGGQVMQRFRKKSAILGYIRTGL
ncbi:CHAP domain-containing protein [Tellurirhabdus bombi]|uniref:CHAP domain-containing protein n=1 Tax=Tellurirhabdus bombi TaxID=2907205 RepID=UPI001F30E535|nr:CHAP domain-containing protein [Tellurirhabdus bombi]